MKHPDEIVLRQPRLSHPAGVRGLKPPEKVPEDVVDCRTPQGCVD